MITFDNIGGIYAKDSTLRQSVNDLRSAVTSKTIKSLTVTNDGTYTANPADGVYGYSPVTVSVNPPWEPLEDGYSNFWFELTDDTLSPRLNFSAKNNDAVIDWGDGSGEVALDTLTPTHTYSKAGKYVVKCKGVTGIARQHTVPYNPNYMQILKNVELNDEVTDLQGNAFGYCVNINNIVNALSTLSSYSFTNCCSLKSIDISTTQNTTLVSVFTFCPSLKSVILPQSLTTLGSQCFYYCSSLDNVVIPASVTAIGNNAFYACNSLSEVHLLPTTPPTLGTNPFSGAMANFVIYVPVGYAETYKAAEGWSAYADHIVEEGQSLSKSQLRAIEEEQKKSDNGEEMR